MKLTELKQKSKQELQRIFDDDRKKLGQLRFGLSAGKVKNVKEVHNLKKEIARILTLIKEGNEVKTSSSASIAQ
ncbi:MAG: 50S ribosomal protein L29 [bacterium]|nr:50S ribosomal protein L29 [bacterium]